MADEAQRLLVVLDLARTVIAEHRAGRELAAPLAALERGVDLFGRVEVVAFQ